MAGQSPVTANDEQQTALRLLRGWIENSTNQAERQARQSLTEYVRH
jgi:hypothetical protein